MSPRRYISANGRRASAQTMDRVLDAAAELVSEDAFHTATMDDLAARAGVSRATVFSRFGSKVGVLEALSLRCAGSPEMRAIRDAHALEDPVEAVNAAIDAACNHWEKQGFILIQLKAIVVLEPEASALIEAQQQEQRAGKQQLARGLARAGRLRPGWTQPKAAAALHTLTSVETFLQLRREHGLPLSQVKGTLKELAQTMIADRDG
jgi:AcrR family transcriptional regulator